MSEIVIFSPILRKDLTLRLKYLASEISQTIQMHFILKPLKLVQVLNSWNFLNYPIILHFKPFATPYAIIWQL